MRYPHRPLISAIGSWVQESQSKQRWHTPGHKGHAPENAEFLQWAWDVTEVGHLAPRMDRMDPLAQSQALMAKSFGVDRTWYSVQGATLPVTAAMLAAFPLGAEIAVDRNAHRSVLSGLVLGGFRPRWIYPDVLGGGMTLPVAADHVQAQLAGTHGVVLTHPTYDGLTRSLKPWIEAAHCLGIPVVVDEAHGAHFLGRVGFPPSAIEGGADLVAHGVHKTEPTLTQTGLLHLQGGLVEDAEVERWWSMLSTSSPSYLLLASLDHWQASRNGSDNQDRWQRWASSMREAWKEWGRLGVPIIQSWWEERGFRADPAKLTLWGDGERLANLLARHGWVEKFDARTVTLILHPDQNLEVLDAAIRDLLAKGDIFHQIPPNPQTPFHDAPVILSPRDVLGRRARWSELESVAGLVAARAVTPYPPGIPAILPGERITGQWLEKLKRWPTENGVWIEGMDRDGQKGMWVIDE